MVHTALQGWKSGLERCWELGCQVSQDVQLQFGALVWIEGGQGEYSIPSEKFRRKNCTRLAATSPWNHQTPEAVISRPISVRAGFDDFSCDVSVYVFLQVPMFAQLRWPAWGWEAKLGDDPSGLILFNSVETHKQAIYDVDLLLKVIS